MPQGPKSVYSFDRQKDQFPSSFEKTYGDPGFDLSADNPFLEAMEADPSGQLGIFQAFVTGRPEFQDTKRRRDAIGGLFDTARQEFMGDTATALSQGQQPPSFSQFLEEFPISARLQQQAGYLADRSLRPSTRFLYGF